MNNVSRNDFPFLVDFNVPAFAFVERFYFTRFIQVFTKSTNFPRLSLRPTRPTIFRHDIRTRINWFGGFYVFIHCRNQVQAEHQQCWKENLIHFNFGSSTWFCFVWDSKWTLCRKKIMLDQTSYCFHIITFFRFNISWLCFGIPKFNVHHSKIVWWRWNAVLVSTVRK